MKFVAGENGRNLHFFLHEINMELKRISTTCVQHGVGREMRSNEAPSEDM